MRHPAWAFSLKLMPDPRAVRNRANAQRSTGPTSPEGKERSSQNSAKHGLSRRSPCPAFSSGADAEAAFNEAQHQAGLLLNDLGRLSSPTMQALCEGVGGVDVHINLQALCEEDILAKMRETVVRLEKLDRYRTPRLRAWLKSCSGSERQQDQALDPSLRRPSSK